MEEDLPSWLDKSFLATVLQGGEASPEVKVTEFSATSAVAAGTNYTSHLYRVQLTYYQSPHSTEQKESLIVKAPIVKGYMDEVAGRCDFYGTEPRVYDSLLPRMYDKTRLEFGPKSFYCPMKNGLILKCLKSEGYVMCDRLKQLDLSHCNAVLKTLAKFHAASIACHHDDPDLVEAIGKEKLYDDGGLYTGEIVHWIQYSFKHFAEVHRRLGGRQETVDMILGRVSNVSESLKNICKPKKEHLNVFNHGDLWNNNILFKYDESGKLVDVKFLDFQTPRFASPMLDITQFLWTSGNEDVRENHQAELFSVYLETLNQTLEELGCEERLTSEAFQEVLKSIIDWVLVMICFEVPLVVCESEDAINMESFSSDDFKNCEKDERIKKLYNGKTYLSLLPGLSRQFEAWISL